MRSESKLVCQVLQRWPLKDVRLLRLVPESVRESVFVEPEARSGRRTDSGNIIIYQVVIVNFFKFKIRENIFFLKIQNFQKF